eukprot:CAMPEP_0203824340 /NCGR_PEP_ID=MMETSP0115-20131106/51559_1 /ASSEMBLY_ACC=CAM_ASM_000227 /TAXON_ID=33651 /ORGANISM="Bicosoecid sp, Strain ms1" /LENGTH=626 /DNA_ID=CAMNT_0050733379 /DNA_START=187 /DNA_END=2064 /DNA_ORIENTATION=+
MGRGTGAWDDHRPKVMAFCCCMTGLVMLIASSVIFAGRLGEEVALWYNVPLCQTSDPDFWVSVDLGASGGPVTCALPQHYEPDMATAGTVHANVLKKFFNAPDFSYKTLIMRSNHSDIWTLPANLQIELNGAYARTSSTLESGTGSAGGGATRRKLLKGSFGSSGFSGPSYRSRNGAYSYWGFGTPYYRGRYGRTSRSPTVTELTIVSVYSKAPVVGPRVTPNAEASTSTPGCNNEETGCEYTVSTPLLKDELTEATWNTGTVESMQSGSYGLQVQAVVQYKINGTDCFDPIDLATVPRIANPDPSKICPVGEVPWFVRRNYPTLFVVFATDQENTEAIIGYVFIPLACVILCCGTIGALSMSWDCCPSCGGRKGYAAYGGDGERLEMAANPAYAGGGGGSGPGTSIITYPRPVVPGSTMRVHDGDHRNLHGASSGYTTVDLTENDVSSLQGIDRCTSLQVLILVNNDLRSLHGIHSAAALQALDVTSNNLRDLSGLGNVPALSYLNVTSNDLTNLGGAGLVPTLRYLCVRNNDIKTLAGVGNFPGLTHLDAGNNALTTIAELPACQMLVGIDLSQNDLTNPEEIMALAGISLLAVLDIRGNDFSAMAKQQIRDHFAATKPAMRLE